MILPVKCTVTVTPPLPAGFAVIIARAVSPYERILLVLTSCKHE